MNVSNATQVYCECKKNHSDVERAVQLAALSTVGGFGLFGNIFTIVVAAKYTVRRNLHFLIINMAISDTLVIVMHLLDALISIMKYKLHDNITAVLYCKLVSIMNVVSHVVSLITLVIISIERYNITRKRVVQLSQPYSTKRRVGLLACSWVIPIILSLYEGTKSSSNGNGECQNLEDIPYSMWVWVCIRTIVKIALFLLLLILSLFTLRMLSRPQAIEESLSEEQRKRRRERIGSAVKMVLYSLLLFSCC